MNVNDLRIAFLGVSHWHVPLYFAGIPEGSVVAVSDSSAEIARRFADQLNAQCYIDWRKLLDESKPDFVFAFARHCDMKEMALELIARGIPFTMEKPLGMAAADVDEIIAAAEKVNAFCAIPFVWRYSDTVAQLKENLLHGKIIHMCYRFIAGPPSRYLKTSPWMLHADTAGGGCMTNLGVHFIDMALNLSDSNGAEVLASAYQYGEYDIETYATSLLKLSSGTTLTLETGYAYPMEDGVQRENRWTIVTEQGYYTLAENNLEVREYGKPVVNIPLSTDSDVYYPKFAAASLDDFVNGRRPRAALPEMLTTRRILDAMNDAARRN